MLLSFTGRVEGENEVTELLPVIGKVTPSYWKFYPRLLEEVHPVTGRVTLGYWKCGGKK
jgi:hypothetical protein